MVRKIIKYFSFQYKAMLMLTLLVSLPFLLTIYMMQSFTESQRIQEKESKLLGITHILANQIGPEGYLGILRQRKAEGASNDHKIHVLNQYLAPITEAVVSAFSNMGVGYYSLELDAILAYGPSAQHAHTVGMSIPPDHPGRTVMRTGQSLVRSGSMVGGDILNAMQPVTRGGNVIGYVWANEPLADIKAQMDAMKKHILTIMLAYGALCVGLLFMLTRGTLHTLDRIINGLRAMRTDFSQRIPESRGEMGEVGRAINAMTESLQAHMSAMHKLTQEKERIAAELDVATRIQTAMLPCTFPPFPHEGEFSLHAAMRPAREVGGDFYDFFQVDDSHMALIIADVSGKGVPAALFMVVAKTLLKNHMQAGLSPCAALAAANNQLCENNSMNMFVTVWAGLLTLKSGHLCYSNAGHNKALVSRNGAPYMPLGTKRGFVVGGMKDSRYIDEHSILTAGDRLLLYTDGITEAENAETCQFGLHRLQECADASLPLPLEEATPFIVAAVDAFTGDLPQTDDITLLMLEFHGESECPTASLAGETPCEAWETHVPALITSFPSLHERLEASLARHHCPAKITHHVLIALEEVFVNIAHYAYPEGQGDVCVECFFYTIDNETPQSPSTESKIMAVLRLSDKGKPFNPLERPAPDLTLTAEMRTPGGLGIHMLHKMMDTLEYQRKNNENVLTLSKQWDVPSAKLHENSSRDDTV